MTSFLLRGVVTMRYNTYLCCYKAAYKMVKVEDSPRLLSGGVFNLRGGSLIFSTNKSPEPLAAAGAIPTSVANC
jgi:hypothetical protein